jgi:hypothetical protein
MKKEKNIQKGINGYSFMHGWFNYLRDNYGKVNTYHSALYIYIVHRANTLRWVEEIGLPTDWTLQRAGFKNPKQYLKTLKELTDFGVIKQISKSRNQHEATIVSLVEFSTIMSEPSAEPDNEATTIVNALPNTEVTAEANILATTSPDAWVDTEASTVLLNSKNDINNLNIINDVNIISNTTIEKSTIDLNSIESRLQSNIPFQSFKELDEFLLENNLELQINSKMLFTNLNFAKGSIEKQLKYIKDNIK